MNGETKQKKVAVIGGGVAGLSACWHLLENSPHHDVTLFEAAETLGGHAHTVKVGDVDVDVGFMVFNDECKHLLVFYVLDRP